MVPLTLLFKAQLEFQQLKESWNWDSLLSPSVPLLECADVCWGEGAGDGVREENILRDFYTTWKTP